jgi:hypothetical protein
MLEVVKQKQRPAPCEVPGKVDAGSERLGNRREDEARLVEGGQRHPEDAVGEVVDDLRGNLERQPRLAAAPGPRKRYDPAAVAEELKQLAEFSPTADELARSYREVRLVQRLQRRKLAVAELEEVLRPDQVLQALRAEIAQADLGVNEPLRRL